MFQLQLFVVFFFFFFGVVFFECLLFLIFDCLFFQFMLRYHQQEVSLTLSPCFCVFGLQINHRAVIFCVCSSKEPKDEGKKWRHWQCHITSSLNYKIPFSYLWKKTCGEKNLGNLKFISVIATSKENVPPPPLPPGIASWVRIFWIQFQHEGLWNILKINVCNTFTIWWFSQNLQCFTCLGYYQSPLLLH